MGAFPLIVLVLMPLGNLLLLSSLEYLIVAEQEYVFQFYISTIITGDTIKAKTKESLISILHKYDYYVHIFKRVRIMVENFNST